MLEAYPSPSSDDQTPWDALKRQVDYAWLAFEMADYEPLGRLLPGVLRAAQNAMTTGRDSGDHSLRFERSAALLVEVYQIASSTLRKLGEPSLAWLAADRGYTLAQRLDDPAQVAATRLEPQTRARKDRALHGHVLLQGAVAAAACGDRAGTGELVDAARSLAEDIPDGNGHYHLDFGPTNVALHAVAALVQLGEGGGAIAAARRIDPAGVWRLRPERRATLLLDLAVAHERSGDRDAALTALLRSEAIASAEVACRPVAQDTIARLARGWPASAPEALTALAERAGVAA